MELAIEEQLEELLSNAEPEPVLCKNCKKIVPWYYLKSDAPESIKSQWQQHKCICRYIDDLMHLRKKYEETQHIERSTVEMLLRELCIMARCPDANDKYLKNRVALGEKYGKSKFGLHSVWQWLFDCNSEQETKSTLEELK